MQKKRLLIVFSILLLIGIGGKLYVHNQKVNEQKVEEVEVEKMSVVALKRTFEDIQSVAFKKSTYNKMTGFYHMSVEMTHNNGEFVEFSYMYTTNQPNEISNWEVVDEEKVQIKGQTNDKVKVVYTNGNEAEV